MADTTVTICPLFGRKVVTRYVSQALEKRASWESQTVHDA